MSAGEKPDGCRDSEILIEPNMASGSESLTGNYKTLRTQREIPGPGTHTGSRPPCGKDAPTGCAAVDYMLRSTLPLVEPVSEKDANSAYYFSLTHSEQNNSDKTHNELKRNFRDDTRKNSGNCHLGNFDGETITSAVRKHFQENLSRKFSWNGNSEHKTDYVTFIKDVQAALPSDSQGNAILGL